jgi:hypothetical protein
MIFVQSFDISINNIGLAVFEILIPVFDIFFVPVFSVLTVLSVLTVITVFVVIIV